MSEQQEIPVDIDDPCIPAGIRAHVKSMMQTGDQLWRYDCLSAPRGPLGLLGLGRREVVTEWWLTDAHGELIDVFWLE